MSELRGVDPLRVLVLADEWPWPSDSGYRQRLDQVVRALSSVAEVDYVGFLADRDALVHTPPHGTVSGRAFAVNGHWVRGLGRRLARWLRTGDPWAVSSRDWRMVRAKVRELTDVAYDVVWFSHCDALVALGDDVTSGPLRIVDVDNIPTAVLHSRLRAPRRGWGLGDWLRCVLDVCDLPRWRRIERGLGSQADVVVVCSETDRRKLDMPQAQVVPNGYALPARTSRQAVVPPVITMVGSMGYEPNRDGASWFVEHVLPLIALQVPGVRLRLVGSTGGRADVRQLGLRPGVEVTGHVDDIAPYLVESAIVIAPIRFGGGTRIKILEGFACRVPVVATTTGCEGLDVVDGTHLLVADTPASFAEACGRLLTEPVLAHRLARAAHDVYLASYRWDLICADIVRSTTALVGERRVGDDVEGSEARRVLDVTGQERCDGTTSA